MAQLWAESKAGTSTSTLPLAEDAKLRMQMHLSGDAYHDCKKN